MTSLRSRPPAGLRAAAAVFAALLFFGVVYRLRLGWALGDTFAGDVPMRALLRQGAADAMFALAVAGMVLFCGQIFGDLAKLPPRLRRVLERLGLGFVGIGLITIGIVAQAHHGAFFATGNGLTSQLVEESLSPAALKELFLLLSPSEAGFMLLPAALFGGLLLLPAGGRRVLYGGSGMLAAALVVLFFVVPAAPLPESLLHHPAAYIALDFVRSSRQIPLVPSALAGNANPGLELSPEAAADVSMATAEPTAPSASEDAPPAPAGTGAAQPPAMALLSPQFVYSASERPGRKTLSADPSQADGSPPYNVLFVIMESTGLDYALRPIKSTEERVAMPFLRSLAGKGYLLRNHFSSGNSSPRGLFSLFSGLYVMPEVTIYDVRKDIYLPSLASYLGERYHRFLVTPGSLDWYFPHAFFSHSGWSELWGYHALPVRKNAPGGRAHARDEAETVGFFLRRLDEHVQSGAPVLAVYYSFLAHWPYPDYGPESHVLPPTRPLHAYYNNLHYLDAQLARIFAHLEEKRLLDRTIVVLVGDHGEAFGQHANNYTHSRMSYNENLRTPAILYQPKLFPPRELTAPTSHVDILPTLLDALGVPYDPALLQGESLFQQEFRRRYIFAYGNEDTLTSVSDDLIKLQLSLRDGSCWVYDLNSDPDEHSRKSCQGHAPQEQALYAYRRQQQSSLRRYNQAAARLSGSAYVVLGRLQAGHSP